MNNSITVLTGSKALGGLNAFAASECPLAPAHAVLTADGDSSMPTRLDNIDR